MLTRATFHPPADAAYVTPDDQVARAMDELLRSFGWSQLSVSLARYLVANKRYPSLARVWIESLFENVEKMK